MTRPQIGINNMKLPTDLIRLRRMLSGAGKQRIFDMSSKRESHIFLKISINNSNNLLFPVEYSSISSQERNCVPKSAVLVMLIMNSSLKYIIFWENVNSFIYCILERRNILTTFCDDEKTISYVLRY